MPEKSAAYALFGRLGTSLDGFRLKLAAFLKAAHFRYHISASCVLLENEEE